MALNYVSLVFTEQDAGNSPSAGPVVIAPTATVVAAGQTVVSQAPVSRQLGGGTVSVSLVACDNAGTTPAAGFWAYSITLPGGQPGLYLINFANGATQQFSNLTPVVAQTTYGPAAGSGFANPMTTLGDLIYENATPAAARLPGDTSNVRKFLRTQSAAGVAQAPAWDTITASDLAALASQQGYTDLTLTPAGALAWGKPWQFNVMAYGAKGDGKIIVDGAMTSGSAVLTTAGLSAPAAPSLAAATTGGTILAGTYQVKITYMNQYGETVASASSSITTTGSTSTITISAPASSLNATAWYAYVTQAGGSSYTRQQAAGSPTSLNLAATLVLTAPPTSSGAQPPGANTTQSNPFSAGDVGKNVLVSGAGGGLYTPLAGVTIASYQGPGQVTLSANATSTVSGAITAWATDDTAAINAAVAAAYAYWLTFPAIEPQVVYPQAIYGVAGPFQKNLTTYGNAQIPTPVPSEYGAKFCLTHLGLGTDSSPLPYWKQQVPQAHGAVLLCLRNDGTNDASFGPSTVIGGPTGILGPSNSWGQVCVTLQNLQILLPYNGTVCGADLYGCAEANVPNFNASALAVVPTSGNPVPTMGTPTNIISANQYVFGLRMPAPNNNACANVGAYSSEGLAIGFGPCEHTDTESIRIVNSYAGIAPFGTYPHAAHITYACVENCQLALSGAWATGAKIDIDCLDTEVIGGAIIYDLGNTLSGTVKLRDTGIVASGYHDGTLAGAFKSAGTAKSLNLIEGDLIQQIATSGDGNAPAAPGSGVAQCNYFYQNAQIWLSSAGGTITAVSVYNQNGVTNMAIPITAGANVGPIALPSGMWFAATYTGTLTVKWVIGRNM